MCVVCFDVMLDGMLINVIIMSCFSLMFECVFICVVECWCYNLKVENGVLVVCCGVEIQFNFEFVD